MQGLFGNLNNTLNNIGLSGNLGLLTTGVGLLEGQPIGQAVQAGLGTYQGLADIEEDRKRKEMIQKLISEGGFTKQEQALIAASNNPAGTAVQIRNQKQSLADAAAARKANRKPTLQEQIDERFAVGQAQGLTGEKLQIYAMTGKVPASARTPDDIYTDALLAGYTEEEAALTRIDPDYVPPRFTGDKITDTTDFKNFKELQKDNPDLTFEQYLRSKVDIQAKGVYKNRETGEIIGEVNFDPYDGTYFQYDESGQKNIIDIRNFSPMTDATFAKTIPNFATFNKNIEELNTDRTSMKRLSEYMTTVNNTNEGLLRLADQFSASAKTLLGGFFKRAFGIDDYTTLSKTEISNKLAQGKLQGLIGRFRIETVGGGVMTEQDALRIIANLGGDVNLLQNKEIVAQQLASLYENKANSLNRKIKLHNNAVRQVYSESGYGPIEEVEIDKSIFTPDRSLLETEETTSTKQTIELKDFNVSEINTYTNDELLGVLNKAADNSKEAIAIVQELRLRGLIK